MSSQSEVTVMYGEAKLNAGQVYSTDTNGEMAVWNPDPEKMYQIGSELVGRAEALAARSGSDVDLITTTEGVRKFPFYNPESQIFGYVVINGGSYEVYLSDLRYIRVAATFAAGSDGQPVVASIDQIEMNDNDAIFGMIQKEHTLLHSPYEKGLQNATNPVTAAREAIGEIEGEGVQMSIVSRQLEELPPELALHRYIINEFGSSEFKVDHQAGTITITFESGEKRSVPLNLSLQNARHSWYANPAEILAAFENAKIQSTLQSQHGARPPAVDHFMRAERRRYSPRND